MIARILATSVSEGGAELRPEHDPYVKRIIPIHDTEFISLLSRRWVWQEEIPQHEQSSKHIEMFSITGQQQQMRWNNNNISSTMYQNIGVNIPFRRKSRVVIFDV